MHFKIKRYVSACVLLIEDKLRNFYLDTKSPYIQEKINKKEINYNLAKIIRSYKNTNKDFSEKNHVRNKEY